VTGKGEAVQAGGGGGSGGLHVVTCHVTQVVRVGDSHRWARVTNAVVTIVASVGTALYTRWISVIANRYRYDF
jgi:hypothetical protein